MMSCATQTESALRTAGATGRTPFNREWTLMNANDFPSEFLEEQARRHDVGQRPLDSGAFGGIRGSDLLLKEEVYQIVGSAMEVLNGLGHGLHEKPYENALIVEFGLRATWFTSKSKSVNTCRT
jgi:hypothetical protein